MKKIEDAPKKDAKVEHDRSPLRRPSNETFDFFSDVISRSEEIAEELVFYDGDYIADGITWKKEENPEADMVHIYTSLIDSVSQDICEFVGETNSFIQSIYAQKDIVASKPQIAGSLSILLEITGLLQHIVDAGEDTIKIFDKRLRYSSYGSVEDVKEIYGERAAVDYRSDTLTEEDYEDAFETISWFTRLLEKGEFAFRLAALVAKLKAYCALKTSSPKEPTVGRDANRTVTLMQFLRKYCEEQNRRLLMHRRKSLNDANSRGSIALPSNVGQWKTGRAKRYYVKDLIDIWPKYHEILPNLPLLKPSE